jgi:hypothetical protein
VCGDTDARFVLVAVRNAATGARVELWQLRSHQHTLHKMFQTANAKYTVEKFTIERWHFIDSFVGPSSAVTALATPNCAQTQPGPSALAYVAVAFSDGSVQCLLKDATGLKHVGGVDLPKAGGLGGESTVALAFTANAAAVTGLTVDGCASLYRLGPLADPGGHWTPALLSESLELAIVSGVDAWDVLLTSAIVHGDAVADLLKENYDKQLVAVKRRYGGG